MKTNCLNQPARHRFHPFYSPHPFLPRAQGGDPAPLFTGQDQTAKLSIEKPHRQKNRPSLFLPEGTIPRLHEGSVRFPRPHERAAKRTTSRSSASVSIPTESHKKFIADYKLNFRLLADPDGKIVDGLRRAGGGQKNGAPGQLPHRPGRQKSFT